ncbi:hybrid sensor histidine kinase/response regulator transcription factor [Flammeovirga kamogawensis]|uniref:histidine kinase n=1 Tax=Flammeovirga kamogawensis TaxID=373891 RepID=A0ABX8H0A5_9BACT|nr:hybrid sensor histidine kinase/response regulator transcription factor [Flammeovirga kamogawensis]MBB6462283.1 signal transduction histidine kinase/ligand-binding sensor domain-containing protein/DNA-binding response OmpR family regulator [Flammeovirga kamogawensis]QWG09324.1 response regulator [Flammeovirga kamogawensis]TRX64846.1 response regulator [Flammeovirga kamogawensis]
MKRLTYFLILLFLSLNILASPRNLELQHIDLPESISSRHVTCFLEDDLGFMWIGLSSGLIKYDGYRSEKMMSNNIRHLIMDKDKNVWVATFSEIFKYDKEENYFTKVDLKVGKITPFSMTLSKLGEVIIGTNKGLHIINTDTEEIVSYQHHKGIDNGLSDNIVRVIYEDQESNLWIGTHDQLNKLDRKTETFTRYRIQDKSEVYKKNNLILDIISLSDKDDDQLLIGTETGIALFDSKTGAFKKYHQKNDEKTLSNDVIKSLCKINNNEVWVGTGYGLNIFSLKTFTFQRYFANYNNHYSISSNIVNVVHKDRSGTIWIGTDNGVDNITFLDNAFKTNIFPGSEKFLQRGISVVNFTEDRIGNIWLATSNYGLIKYDKKKDEYEYFKVPRILHSSVKQVLVDKENKVWIVTVGGLNVYDQKTKKMYAYVADKANELALQTNYLFCIGESPKGQIWLGSMYGVYKLNQKENNKIEFVNFRKEDDNENSISGNYISSITFHNNENPWIATGDGVNYFNLSQGKFYKYPMINKTRVLNLNQLVVDDEGAIWGASKRKVYKFNKTKSEFDEVFSADNIIRSFQVNGDELWYATNVNIHVYNFSTAANLVLSSTRTGIKNFNRAATSIIDGRIYFGGLSGFVSFLPNEVNKKSIEPTVRITGLKVSNKEVKVNKELNDRVLFTKNLNKVDQLTLDHEENTFTIYFSAMDYREKNTHNYQFKLEGLQDEWETMSGLTDFVSYNKIKPGKYTFKVRASNNFGEFGENFTALNFVINPPIWATWWAKVIYFTMLTLLFFIARKISVKNVKVQNKLHLEQVEREKSEEVNQMKIKFFTNISHELRTPLTLISSPLDELETIEVDTQKLKLIQIIQRNTARLSRLVNQVLDLRKIDQGAEKLSIEEYDIVRLSRNITHDFMETALQRNIDLNFNTNQPEGIMWFDLEKLEKVIYNLISNSLKYTPDNGTIGVKMDVTKASHPYRKIPITEYQQIIITDSGIGIPKDLQSQIFERFTNIKMDNFMGQQGTGIGLSLVHDYVKMHGGWVELKSEEGSGSEFTVYLPLSKTFIEDYEEKHVEKELIEEEYHPEEETKEEEIESSSEKGGKEKILVVEDDRDMQSFLVHCLEETYHVITANNGKEGWDKAKKEMPDLILSDVMMPEMDGIEFCTKAKSDLLTNHIPFVLLTAKGGIDNKKDGIEHGADDYIAKPFNVDYLRVRVNNILTQREKLRESFRREMKTQPNEVVVPSFEEKFLDEVMQEIEKNMDNSEFNVKILGEKIGMGQTNLYRKIKSMTGMTANEFIRNVRLKRAGQLLKQGQYNVSDVMYMVGFTHRSYFSKSFKEVYGVTPKEYTKQENVVE